MMMGLLLFNMFMFPLIATSITMPGITNPISDLIPGFGQSASGTGAGTTQCNSQVSTCAALTDTIKPANQNIQSCLVGAGTGALTGAIVGTIIPGIGNVAGAIGGALIGGFGGCAIASTFFPSQGSSLYQYVASNSGPLGDFTNALVSALAWVGPILRFFQDMVGYEFALLVNAPEIGAFLFPFQAMMAIMFIYVGAEYIRGTGIGA
jgi:hypothetical protein